MEYKLTFEDGSDGYLEHYGIKGMKWGVWNDETRARRMGYSEHRNSQSSAKRKPFLDDRQKKMLKTGAKAFAVAVGVGVAATLVEHYARTGSLAVADNAKEILQTAYNEKINDSTSKLLNAMKNGADTATIESLKKNVYDNVQGSKRAKDFVDKTQKGFVAVASTGGSLAMLATDKAGLYKTIEAGGGLNFYKEKKQRELKKKQKASEHKSPFDTRITTTKNGETLMLERNKGGALAKGLRKISPNIRKKQDRTYDYDLKVNGKKVGNLQMYQKKDDEMNVVWGSTKDRYRRKGYMTAAITEGEKIAKELGNSKITGELVGNSPGNSIHKLVEQNRGWEKVGEVRTKDVMDMWGGLTLVEKRL